MRLPVVVGMPPKVIDKELIRKAVLSELDARMDHAYELLSKTDGWSEQNRMALEKAERAQIDRIEQFSLLITNLIFEPAVKGEASADGTVWVAQDLKTKVITYFFYVKFDPEFVMNFKINTEHVQLACSNIYGYSLDAVGQVFTRTGFYDGSVEQDKLVAVY